MEPLRNVHADVSHPTGCYRVSVVEGDYYYYHYGADVVNDKGWGCGYRTLQTMCSWIRFRQEALGLPSNREPTIRQVQQMLVEMGDKPPTFVGSRDWIGTYEVSICIDFMYEVPCKILHCRNVEEVKANAAALLDHFSSIGCPAMIGGDRDAASKTVLGIALHQADSSQSQLLILDPHYVGVADVSTLIREGWIGWTPMTQLSDTSFYNICLPQFQARQKTLLNPFRILITELLVVCMPAFTQGMQIEGSYYRMKQETNTIASPIPGLVPAYDKVFDNTPSLKLPDQRA